MRDKLVIGGVELNNRLFVGTGKYPSNALIKDVLENSGAQVITLAVRRVDFDHEEEDILANIPEGVILLPNTSGARNAEEAVRIARLAKAMGCGNWIKIEVISDSKYLLPDNEETIKATKILADEGFVVLPYMCPYRNNEPRTGYSYNSRCRYRKTITSYGSNGNGSCSMSC